MSDANPSGEELAHWQTLRIRRALTRVEFAASQLARELRGERERAWVAGIRHGIDELEREWAARSPWPTTGTRKALCAALRAFDTRWSAVLRETGVELEVNVEGAEILMGDPWLVRRAGLALLRVGRESLGGAGRLRLCALPIASGAGFGLEISWETGAASPPGPLSIDALRDVCVAGGAFVERGVASVCLWFSDREEACCDTP